MYTQCPSCATIYAITTEQLQIAEGEARCGLCNEAFFAVDSLSHEVPPPSPDKARPVAAKEEATDRAVPATTQTRAQGASASPQSALPGLGEVRQLEAPRTTPAERSAGSRAAADWMERVLGLETTAEESSGRSLWRQVGMGGGIVLLLVLAALQYGHFNSAALATDPQFRPYVQRLCALTGCPVPLRRAPDQMALVSRTVQSHPRISGSLLVEATMVNNAPFPQPLPQVQLKLRALNGKVTGARWFMPEQYLAGENDRTAGDALPPGETVRLKLEVVEPSRDTQGFEFAFR